MTETFRCGDEAALVTFLYDDGEPGERELVAAHVAGCRRCAAEIAGMASARQVLSAWTPPDVRLGFRISSEEAASAVVDARSAFGPRDRGRTPAPSDAVAAWWRRPLPAWAQAAAAVLIFGAGLTAGTTRDGARTYEPVAASRPTATALEQSVANLEQRLAGVEQVAEARPAAVEAPAIGLDAATVMRQVRQEIAASERRQNVKLAKWTLQMMFEQNEVQALSEERVGTNLNSMYVRLASLR